MSDHITNALERTAEEMCLAARTAPKARGLDFLEFAILKGDEIMKLSAKMKEIGEREDNNTFRRDSENIKKASVLVLIGTKKQTIGLKYCSYCGFADCAANEKAGAVCAYNTGDLGIAIGSAVAVAADRRVDNRVMYSVGRAAVDLKLMGKDVAIAYGIPLSATGKNPFFDRK
ncbi:ferredoxin [candidate division WOR-1 bacterium RIFCSPHIGHO2_01_FULL_53_15]|uniref:Ferredoxin n=1 Tax=candidate division WOR-1 bacterium RIFCSPHIGHO2_01_FULL_53_15 TaxID=1802564 RepID=A0A1F4Q067_UNCSA|nr:MAG: ferredoxin [candidate division WOR-1 bacterium RIFCSPHIGHO2_01_FULL_53_15]OGC12733.1 MAG: ferredoxin [candidate division WOR-1 bacterium RIFCSPHIGHO2_02_FULL_53_26]